jgi:hypothetical protein
VSKGRHKPRAFPKMRLFLQTSPHCRPEAQHPILLAHHEPPVDYPTSVNNKRLSGRFRMQKRKLEKSELRLGGATRAFRPEIPEAGSQRPSLHHLTPGISGRFREVTQRAKIAGLCRWGARIRDRMPHVLVRLGALHRLLPCRRAGRGHCGTRPSRSAWRDCVGNYPGRSRHRRGISRSHQRSSAGLGRPGCREKLPPFEGPQATPDSEGRVAAPSTNPAR